MAWNHTWLQENRKSQRSWNGPSKGRRCGRDVVEKMIIMAILLAVIWLLSPWQNGHSSFSMASWHQMHCVTCRNHLTGGSRARFKSLCSRSPHQEASFGFQNIHDGSRHLRLCSQWGSRCSLLMLQPPELLASTQRPMHPVARTGLGIAPGWLQATPCM